MEGAYEKDRKALMSEQYFLLQIYNANSYFHQKQYRKAESIYRIALISRKSIVKGNTALARHLDTIIETYPEQEIRYKIDLCLEQVNEITEAFLILTAIYIRFRTPKINMMIGKLSVQLGKTEQAVTAFETALYENPLNLEAIKALFALGVHEVEISKYYTGSKLKRLLLFLIKFVSNVMSFTFYLMAAGLPIQIVEWLNYWVEVKMHIRNCEFPKAIESIQDLREKSQFAKNELINVLLGQCVYYNGDLDNALGFLKRAHANNFYMLDGLSKA